MAAEFVLRVYDVEHGACAIMADPSGGRIAMIDCGHNNTKTGVDALLDATRNAGYPSSLKSRPATQ